MPDEDLIAITDDSPRLVAICPAAGGPVAAFESSDRGTLPSIEVPDGHVAVELGEADPYRLPPGKAWVYDPQTGALELRDDGTTGSEARGRVDEKRRAVAAERAAKREAERP